MRFGLGVALANPIEQHDDFRAATQICVISHAWHAGASSGGQAHQEDDVGQLAPPNPDVAHLVGGVLVDLMVTALPQQYALEIGLPAIVVAEPPIACFCQ